MPTIELGPIDVQWLQVLSEGWATPLPGFMRERQYLQTLHFGQLLDLKEEDCVSWRTANSFKDDDTKDPWQLNEPINQSIPIVLPITEEQRKNITI
ncbi:hypothetical protein KIN20_025265, partial [Parelaphostrongylus tenuis]